MSAENWTHEMTMSNQLSNTISGLSLLGNVSTTHNVDKSYVVELSINMTILNDNDIIKIFDGVYQMHKVTPFDITTSENGNTKIIMFIIQ